MHSYYDHLLPGLQKWQHEMRRPPGIMNTLAKKVQDKMNSIIPEKLHRGITKAIKEMVRAVLFGAMHTSMRKQDNIGLEEIEKRVEERIKFYKHTAAAEGGITGAGGIVLAIADFPLLLTIKMKMLFDIASLYGFDVNDYRERIYILQIFQLAFSSQARRQKVFENMTGWDDKKQDLPQDINDFEWRSFQQEYRDYIDLAKLAQLIPGIGAVVGVFVNYRLLKKLGTTAMNSYRMRLIDQNT